MTGAALDEVTAATRMAAEYAVDRAVESGMRIGLGTGSTAVWAIRRLGSLLASGALRDVVAVPTSDVTATDAQAYGIPLTTLEANPVLDVTVDGADEVDDALDCIKGGGGAHLREKLVAQATAPLVIVVDSSKLAPALGTAFPLPVEVIQMARVPETLYLEALGFAVRGVSATAGRSSPTRATGSSMCRRAPSRTSRDCRTGCSVGPGSSRWGSSSGWPVTSSSQPPARTSATSPASRSPTSSHPGDAPARMNAAGIHI